jgi:hypothetical protein
MTSLSATVPTSATVPLQTEDLLIGILAVLSLRGRDSLKTTDKIFHAAFGEALNVFRADTEGLGKLAESYYPDVVSNTYDELNHALIAAESHNLIRFPNPSYRRLQITMTPRVATALLNSYGNNTAIFEEAATLLLERLTG